MQALTPEQRAAQSADDYINTLVNMTEYTGNKDAGQRIFSVSSLGVEPLQNWLSFKYGKSDKTSFTASTIGSIYQLGCDTAIERLTDNGMQEGVELPDGSIVPRFESAVRIRRELPNGWIISGEMDHLDNLMKVIIDNKVIRGSAYKEIMKNLKDHDYNLQQAGYKWLLKPTHGDYEAILSIVNKGGAAIRNDILTNLHLNTYTTEEIEEAFINATDNLQFYIDNDITPEQCDIFKYGKTKDVPNRCALYCSHNHHCPHYSPFKREKDIIARLSIV